MTEAERLATHLEKKPRWTHEIEAAALLRSLQAENEALRKQAVMQFDELEKQDAENEAAVLAKLGAQQDETELCMDCEVCTADRGCPPKEAQPSQYGSLELQSLILAKLTQKEAQQEPVGFSWNLKYTDSTPKLNVMHSAFEDWFQQQPFATQHGIKQLCRDSYAAGMGDPLVTYATTPPNTTAVLRQCLEALIDDRTEDAIAAIKKELA